MAISKSKKSKSKPDPRRVTAYIDGNMTRWGPLDNTAQVLLQSELTYTRRKFLATYQQRREAGTHMQFQEINCYSMREHPSGQHLVTNTGYFNRLERKLLKHGYLVKTKNMRPHKHPEIFEPLWSQIQGIKFRHKQRETLQRLATVERGQVFWATGAGKTWLIPCLCLLFNRCRILVTTRHLPVIETIYSRLQAQLPHVGMLTSRKKERDKRVMCVSAGSLHHAVSWEPDILIADEVHELATDRLLESLSRFRFSRMYGLSANFQDRMDGADFELEGLFGPLVAELSYQEATKNELVVPIKVLWRNVYLDRNPVAGKEGVPVWRHGIWRNRARNRLIAEDARKFVDEQVLIVVKTLEHACHLKYLLPDFELCYAPLDTYSERLDEYRDAGLLHSEEPAMTHHRLTQLRKKFERGKLKKVIATSVWNRGVDFKKLQVLIRADGGASAIDDTQIPGRLSRISAGKESGILIDYLDQFDPGLERRALKRKRDYAAKGWEQVMPLPT